jgi:hypothetical protein
MRCPRCDEPIPINPGAIFYCQNPKHCYFVEKEMPEPRDPLLVEREKTHGSFTMTAKVAQEIKEALRWGPLELKHAQLEALEMIATKMARIVCGNANEKDHYNDIAGYAKLGAEACD